MTKTPRQKLRKTLGNVARDLLRAAPPPLRRQMDRTDEKH